MNRLLVVTSALCITVAVGLLLLYGCNQQPVIPNPRPLPQPVPVVYPLAEKKEYLAKQILVGMYSHREGLRTQGAQQNVAEARAVAEEFYKQQ